MGEADIWVGQHAGRSCAEPRRGAGRIAGEATRAEQETLRAAGPTRSGARRNGLSARAHHSPRVRIAIQHAMAVSNWKGSRSDSGSLLVPGSRVAGGARRYARSTASRCTRCSGPNRRRRSDRTLFVAVDAAVQDPFTCCLARGTSPRNRGRSGRVSRRMMSKRPSKPIAASSIKPSNEFRRRDTPLDIRSDSGTGCPLRSDLPPRDGQTAHTLKSKGL